MKRHTYTVPSRLEAEILRVHVYHDRLECYLGSQFKLTLRRSHKKESQEKKRTIDYRHVIDSLVRKPQAFRYSQIRDDLLPTEEYKRIWAYVDEHLPGKTACKFIVGLLYLAAKTNKEEIISNEVYKPT